MVPVYDRDLRLASIGSFRVPKSCAVYTPRALAEAMVASLNDDPSVTWLDPCIGRGVFLEALARIGVPSERIRGLDARKKTEEQDRLARTLRPQEFLSWSANSTERFDRIVANPPYLAISRLSKAVKRAACAVRTPDGRGVPEGANTWYAFLCASIALLRPGGSLCFVLPAAWDYADYSGDLRGSIGSFFDEVHVHRCRTPLFAAVQDGSVVVVAKGKKAIVAAKSHSLRFEHSSADALIAAVSNSRACKTAIPIRTAPPIQVVDHAYSLARDVFHIRLGGVTGDAEYFVMTESERSDRALPREAMTPVVSRARHLRGGSIGLCEWRQLRDEGGRVWLFRPPKVWRQNPIVSSYLRRCFSVGGCNRSALKIKTRRPWYITPLPTPVHGFMSGMSGWGPWVVFNQMAGLSATNTLYAITFSTIAAPDERAAWAMSLLTTATQERLRPLGRHYAAGLVKYEPSDIANLPLLRPVRTRGALRQYLVAVARLLAGDSAGSREIADAWCHHEPRTAANAV